MPSKRKKNKRRMRRVQAQRRALEEQHAASPPVKASSGTVMGAPPIATPKKATKTPPATREKLPQATSITVPIVEPPKAEPEPVVKEDATEAFQAEVAAAESDGVLLKQASAESEVESRVEDEVEGPSCVTKEEPVKTSPPVEPSKAQADLVQVEVSVSDTEPTSEVEPPEEAPVVVAAEVETHEVSEEEMEKAPTPVEDDNETKVEVEGPIAEEVTLLESAKEAAEEPEAGDVTRGQCPAEAEAASGNPESDGGSEVEVVTETLESEKEVEMASPAEPAEDEEDNLAEEDSTAESVTATEDIPAPTVETPTVLNTITEAPLEEAEPLVVEATEALRDTEGKEDTFSTQTESIDATPADSETAAVLAGENAVSNQTCLAVPSDEPKSGDCDVPCQGQLPVEAVQLGAVELSVEITQNGNMVPEVSIEG